MGCASAARYSDASTQHAPHHSISVTFVETKGVWTARIIQSGKRISLGSFRVSRCKDGGGGGGGGGVTVGTSRYESLRQARSPAHAATSRAGAPGARHDRCKVLRTFMRDSCEWQSEEEAARAWDRKAREEGACLTPDMHACSHGGIGCCRGCGQPPAARPGGRQRKEEEEEKEDGFFARRRRFIMQE